MAVAGKNKAHYSISTKKFKQIFNLIQWKHIPHLMRGKKKGMLSI